MSKLNGMQIFELLSDVNDNLIVESASPTLLAGGATAAAAGASSAGTASVAAKTGFAAWLAKGGWLVLASALVVTVGMAVGGFFLMEGLGEQFDWSDFSDLLEGGLSESGRDTQEHDFGEDTSYEENDENDTEAATEAVTEGETEPPPTADNFAEDSLLSLFSAEQGVVSLGEDGALVAEAQWAEGDKNFSTLCFDPRAVMQALGSSETNPRGVLLIKIRRENAMITAPTVYFGTEELGRNKDVTVPVYQYNYYLSNYEYVVMDLNCLDAYTWEATPYVYVEWLRMDGNSFTSEGRRMTVYEISFYEDIWDAFLATEEKLAEDGVKHPSVKYMEDGKSFDVNNVRVPFFFLEAKDRDGQLKTAIYSEPFTNSQAMRVAVLHEGFTLISGRIMIGSDALQAVYLPDSLIRLEGDSFHFCPKLTRVRVGRGIEFIDSSTFYYTVTDIDYNGTMAEWCQVDRDGSKNTRITVHCLDGDIPYSASSPDHEQTDAKRDALAWEIPFSLAEGQSVAGMESTYLTLTNQKGGEVTVLLRWALTGKKNHPAPGYDAGYLFYFDVLNAEDGSVLYVFDREESLAYAREEGSSLFLAQGGRTERSPQSATLFLTNYGYSDDKSTFTARTTHFRLELTESGEVTVNREVSEKLKDDVTIACPVEKTAELARLRQVFMDINEYMGETYDLSNLRPARLLLVTRPHGDSAFFSHRLAPVLDGFVLAEQETFLDVANFNFQTLEYLYESYGVYDVLD